MPQFLHSFEDILWFLVLIGVMINVHELGHFWVARRFDVKVEAFSFGFGPRLFGFRRGETDYRFSLIPFGGYVKMAGEQPPDADAGAQLDPRSVLAKPRWQRLLIALAGPMMNVFLAVGLLTGLYMASFPKLSRADQETVIGGVLADSPAAKAGIHPGDRIVRLDNKQDPTWEDVQLKEAMSAYQPLAVTVDRAGQRLEMVITPSYNDKIGGGTMGWDKRGEVELYNVDPAMPAGKSGLQPGDTVVAVNGQPIDSAIKLHDITEGSGGKPLRIEYQRKGHRGEVTVTPVFDKKDGPARWMIGVGPALRAHYENVRLSLPAAFDESLRENWKEATMIGKFLQGVVQRRMSAKNITGPIGMAPLAGDAARQGPSMFLGLMAAVSLNLAIFNMLPIPILDGGGILLLLVEMVMRRDLSLTVKEAVFKVGFVFIMLVVAFVLYNDISRILPPG